MDKCLFKASALTLAVAAGSAQAALDDVRVHAFATLGVASMHGEADDTRYGLNSEYKADETLESVSRGAVQLAYDFNDKLSGTLQLLADRGREANGVELNIDWAYLAYQASDELALRAGQLRAPLFMLSETIDVGYSYVWVRPPQTYYQMVPFSSYYAVDALWNLELGQGSLLVQPFAGRAEEQEINAFGLDEVDLDAEDAYGVNLVYSFDYGSVRAGAFLADASLAQQNGPARLSNSDVAFYSAGYNLEYGNWLSIAEISTKDSVTGDSQGGAGEQIPEDDAWYLMVGHRFGDFTTHVTYAEASSSTDKGVQVGDQESVIVGLRYDWQPGVAVKFEYETIETTDGTNGAFTAAERGNRDAEIFTLAIDYVM